MKRILFFILSMWGIAQAQTAPANYTDINSRYQWLAGRFKALTAPAGITPALTTGQWPIAGALFVDTTGTKGLYVYYDGVWNSAAGIASNIYTADGILQGDRVLTGLENAYSLTFDSVRNFAVHSYDVNRSVDLLIDADAPRGRLSVTDLNGTNSFFADEFGLNLSATSAADSIKLTYSSASGTLLTDSRIIARTPGGGLYNLDPTALGGNQGLQDVITQDNELTDAAASVVNASSNTTGTFTESQGIGGTYKGIRTLGYNANNYMSADAAGNNIGGLVTASAPTTLFGSTSRYWQSFLYTYLNATKWQYMGIDSNRAKIIADTTEITGPLLGRKMVLGIPGTTPQTGANYILQMSANNGTYGDGKSVGVFYLSSPATNNKVAFAFGTLAQHAVGIFTNNGNYQASFDTTKGMTIGSGYAPNSGHIFAPPNGLVVQGPVWLDSAVRANDLPTGDTTTYKPIGIDASGFIGKVSPGWPVGSGSGAAANSNIGSNYEWLKPAGQEIKSARKGLYMLIDSATANTLTFGVDTTTMFPAIRTTIPAAGATALSALTAASGSNTINNVANAQEWQWNSLAGGTGMSLTSTSTAAASNTQTLFNVGLSGTNGTTTQTTTAANITNTHTGTSSTNYGLQVTASGATNNWAAKFTPTVLIGSPTLTNAANHGLVLQAPTSTASDGIRIYTNNLTSFMDIGYAKMTRGGSYEINTTSGSLNLTPTVGTRVGSTSAATALLHLDAGTTSKAPMRFTSGPLTTSTNILAGNVEFLTDKWYGTLTTGPAAKEFTMNDAALTSGTVPVATTNGRLTDGLIIASNTYVPTYTGVANVASVTNVTARYIRIGDIIDVTVQFTLNATAPLTPTTIGISLPVASNFGATTDADGSLIENGGALGAVGADAANDRLTVTYNASTTSSITVTVHAKYSRI